MASLHARRSALQRVVIAYQSRTSESAGRADTTSGGSGVPAVGREALDGRTAEMPGGSRSRIGITRRAFVSSWRPIGTCPRDHLVDQIWDQERSVRAPVATERLSGGPDTRSGWLGASAGARGRVAGDPTESPGTTFGRSCDAGEGARLIEEPSRRTSHRAGPAGRLPRWRGVLSGETNARADCGDARPLASVIASGASAPRAGS
jgi:hypothetical protein